MDQRSQRAQPILITDAAQSRIDEHNARRKRYTITMGVRIVCLVLAAVFYHIVWVMGIFVAFACVLPWMAVLIANDRPPKKAQKLTGFSHPAPERALGTAVDQSRIIDL